MKLAKTTIKRPYYNIKVSHRGDKDDLAVIREMFEENVYRFEGWKLEQDNPVVLDIGANIGTFTLQVLNAMHELGRPVTVYAVEPEKNNLKLLKKNLKDNSVLLSGGSKVVVVEKAISDFIGDMSITNNSGSSRLTNKEGLQEVKVTTFDWLLRDYGIEKIDFTKIDIEGSEWPLVRGASHKVLESSHYYAIEFDQSLGVAEFLDTLKPFMRCFSLETWGVPSDGCNIYLENHKWSKP